LFIDHLINPHFIIVLRHPLGRADSIVKYTQNKSIYRALDRLEALDLANTYYRQLYKFFKINKTRPHVFVSFENTISNPLKTVNDLSEFLKIELKEDTISDIYKFVVPRAQMKEMKEEMRKKKVKHKMLAKFRRYLAKKISRRSDS